MNRPRQVSKDEIITAIQKCAAELGRGPTFLELNRAFPRINKRRVLRLFATYGDALREAGLEPNGPGNKATLEELFDDWARTVRAAGRIPTVREYERRSRYSLRPLTARFGMWSAVPKGMLDFMEQRSITDDWEDVTKIIIAYLEKWTGPSQTSTRGGLWRLTPGAVPGRSEYGDPILFPGMANAPTTELGVVLLFGMVARELEFVVLRTQPDFPDCEVLRKMEQGRWQKVRIEFEWQSRSFLHHKHDPAGCDMVVCWEHNWPECPVEVLELRKVVESLESPTSRVIGRPDYR